MQCDCMQLMPQYLLCLSEMKPLWWTLILLALLACAAADQHNATDEDAVAQLDDDLTQMASESTHALQSTEMHSNLVEIHSLAAHKRGWRDVNEESDEYHGSGFTGPRIVFLVCGITVAIPLLGVSIWYCFFKPRSKEEQTAEVTETKVMLDSSSGQSDNSDQVYISAFRPVQQPHDVLKSKKARYWIILSVIIVFTTTEIVVAVMTKSLALLSEAFLNLGEVITFIMALQIERLREQPKNSTFSYGYPRAEVVGALLNGSSMLALGFFVVLQAVPRFFEPVDILSGPLFIGTAAVGLLINLMGVAMFYSGEGGDTDMNMRGVFVHFLADTLSSICVVTTALLLYYYETSYWVQHIDSISSLLIVVISFYLAFPLVRKCVYLVMQSTPIEIDTVQLEAALHKCDGDFTRIAHVGDLHVWSLNSNEHVASVSVGLRAHDPADAADACKWAPEIIERVKHVFAEHNVRQTCVQIELLPAQEPIAI